MDHLIEMLVFYWLNIWKYQNTQFCLEYHRNYQLFLLIYTRIYDLFISSYLSIGKVHYNFLFKMQPDFTWMVPIEVMLGSLNQGED